MSQTASRRMIVGGALALALVGGVALLAPVLSSWSAGTSSSYADEVTERLERGGALHVTVDPSTGAIISATDAR